jgi:hypothetical protein
MHRRSTFAIDVRFSGSTEESWNMFNDFGAFHASLQQAWPEKNVPQEKAKTYYEWYQKARSQTEIVLGREKDLESLKKQYGVAEEGGSMLIGVTNWDILVNDSWILGGIHKQLPFLLKTVLTFASVYNVEQKDNPDQTRVMYVTTREIAGLNLFGYRKNKQDADGQLFLCEEKNTASDANFKSYRIHTQAVAAAALS